jgi:ABC-2 type transport system permease protein
VASIAEDQARARAARRRDLHPDPVHADVHLPVRRRALRVDRRLPPVPAAGHADDDPGARQRLYRRGAEHRHHQGRLDRFRSLPIWRPAALVGALLGDAARNLLAAAIVIALGLAIGFRPDGGAVGVLLAVALLLVFSFSVAWIWTALALVLRTPSAVSNVSLLFVFPLAFASNVFVEPQTMPGWLQTVVDVNPISHLVTAERGLMHGTATAGQIGWVLVASAAQVAVFAPQTMHLYRAKQ